MTATAVLKMQRAGLTEQQVEAIADYVAGELAFAQLATKADVALVRADVGALATATKADLAQTRAELEARIAEAKTDIVKWVVGVGFVQAVTLIGALLTFLKLFPGGHP